MQASKEILSVMGYLTFWFKLSADSSCYYKINSENAQNRRLWAYLMR